MKRFKIDFRKSYTGSYPVGLFFRRVKWMPWRQLDMFETVEAARASYEKIKDLPEYLD